MPFDDTFIETVECTIESSKRTALCPSHECAHDLGV
jgi:hypothetical protein